MQDTKSSRDPDILTTEWQPIGPERHELGEGARWINGLLYFVDLLNGRLLRYDPQSSAGPTTVIQLDIPIGAVAPTRDGAGYMAAAGTGLAHLSIDGELTWISRPADGHNPQMRVNDACADPYGRFWFGTMAWDNTPGAGRLYRHDAHGTTDTALTDLTVPNGPVFSADGRTMYLADTAESSIYRLNVDQAGSVGKPTVFAQVNGHPDGMTIDAEGFLWTAIWGGGRLQRYATDGTLTHTISVPAVQPTSVAISCGDQPQIAVTTATYGLESPAMHDGHTLIAATTTSGTPICAAAHEWPNASACR